VPELAWHRLDLPQPLFAVGHDHEVDDALTVGHDRNLSTTGAVS
jgi:hypothetical protein